ncbi:uncharacterized protein LOC113286753 [Papaver somniferum]|uniref:uncharacterized protein LOC113286753 n=1 Tax=Papaver somniferum TaxID=3469 RepID=UPI000E6F4DC4|nr:uncharacterized protein LOC113286753 [Papaver somniferum]
MDITIMILILAALSCLLYKLTWRDMQEISRKLPKNCNCILLNCNIKSSTRKKQHFKRRLQNWKKRCPDKSLFEAEVAREIVNRIQKLTKKAGPEPTDTMEVY